MRDRHREREEIEELKRKLAEQGYADPEAELARVGVCLLFHFALHRQNIYTTLFCM